MNLFKHLSILLEVVKENQLNPFSRIFFSDFQTIVQPQMKDDYEEEEELLRANFRNDRRDSEMSELYRFEKSIVVIN